MRKNDKTKRVADETLTKIRAIARHVRNVEDNCLILGEALIIQGHIELGKKLIANGFVHDSSKFTGIEFEFMSPNQPTKEDEAKLKMKLAIHQHNSTQPHHPEYWSSGIKGMPDVYLCEMAADWKSRSEEFGTNLREWIDDEATKKFNFSKDDEVYKKIMSYVDILCQKPFENLNK